MLFPQPPAFPGGCKVHLACGAARLAGRVARWNLLGVQVNDRWAGTEARRVTARRNFAFRANLRAFILAIISYRCGNWCGEFRAAITIIGKRGERTYTI